jgi:hypothetical protein
VRPRRAEQFGRDDLIVRTQDGEIHTPVKTLRDEHTIGDLVARAPEGAASTRADPDRRALQSLGL